MGVSVCLCVRGRSRWYLENFIFSLLQLTTFTTSPRGKMNGFPELYRIFEVY